MKDISIVRYVDKIGRVVVPTEIRQRFGWVSGVELEILVGDDCVCYRRYRHQQRALDVLQELKDTVDCDVNIRWDDRSRIDKMLKGIERILKDERY